MYRCYVCGHSDPTITKFRAHLYRHSGLAELKMPIMCGQGNCKASFAKVYNLLRHVECFHASDEMQCLPDDSSIFSVNGFVGVTHVSVNEPSCKTNGAEVCQPYDTSPVNDSVNSLDDLQTEAISLVAGLRANSSIPYSTIPGVINSFQHMAASLTDFVETVTEESVQEAGIDTEMSLSLKQAIHERLQPCRKPLDFLSSVYRQDKYFENHDLFVKPESVCFGSRYESHSGVSKLVYDSFQYVSVLQTLKSLVQSEMYVKALLDDKVVPGLYQNYADGERAMQHELFGNVGKFSIMIQLFYDGLGTTNPLRGQSSINNIGVFFYTIKNLPARYNSCFANVYLLALCYSEDLKKYGFDPVLEKFVAEISPLHSIGFEANVNPLGGRITVYASLCQVTCDNLALNGLLGFIESFSGDFFCTLCYATQDMIQKFFRDDFFNRRTISDYENDVSKLSETACRIHYKGVKKNCVLNRIRGYHVTENWSLDIMHIVLEGIVPVELGCILYGLCVEHKLFNVNVLNREIQLFWGQMTVSKCEKPPTLSRLLEPGQGLAPSMKAVQCWSLLKYMPLVMGKLVPKGNEHWKFMLHLSQLVDLVFAPRFTAGMIEYMKDVIEEHLSNFSQLYSAKWHVKLRPKHHLLVHLPAIVRKSGPLVGMSCMRYELKNSFFKRTAHTVCNFSNICHTLAQRHQHHFLYSLLSSQHIRSAVIVGRQFSVSVCSFVFCEILCTELHIEATDDVSVTNRLTVAGVQYARGNIVVLDINEVGPVFGKISTFVCSQSGEWCLVVEVIQAEKFCYHFHAHAIQDVILPVYKVVKFDELADHHALHCCVLRAVESANVKLVRLPYHIVSL